uniref:Uncharacterized protein n=1 Tax=Vibrio sp. VP5(2010) TaxID=749334 RepID=D5JEI6_9VIBR|nr:hypothetical protein repV5-ORF1 [Vibrio sp. VP5(2010)]
MLIFQIWQLSKQKNLPIGRLFCIYRAKKIYFKTSKHHQQHPTCSIIDFGCFSVGQPLEFNVIPHGRF